MQEKIRRREYVVTFHAKKEMIDDNFTIYDVERGFLTGEIIERQKDETSAEWKYCIKGKQLVKVRLN